ncbi:hypothetical protein Dester_0372 [Desulfurobacterium thermolithotrophum DSM 11699]|uniref:Uncharacterized protein n=1 Tax=Desulfurobacterium thermolithotrophum (strain DSM 11699 / BSA) TaxID=868864 RepID=F0S284_DESTD|nr:hypothetical protein [Desulfurobacterium thermolithotrophum]ADY73027.1 hypothetical protein Dester_0372 [Desulfurobacterium thermolithotrophum DSM 11699]
MRIYFGYPDSFFKDKNFRLKDLFLREIGVKYETVPVEVRRKLLSLLDNLEQKSYLYLNGIVYDAIDILEFAFFSLSIEDLQEIVLPGYLYGKSTFLIRNLFDNLLERRVSVYYDFNFFSQKTLVVNIGYKKTSLSIGGKLITILPVGEYHFVDILGNYLFNRFILEVGISNRDLRKKGERGKLLDKFRSFAGQVLFKNRKEIFLENFRYKRSIEKEEVRLAISPYTGLCNYGDFIEKPVDISSSVVLSLYSYEELFRERAPIEKIILIGRLTFPFEDVLGKIFPIPIEKLDGKEMIGLSAVNPIFKVSLRKIDFPLDGRFPNLKIPSLDSSDEINVSLLRKYYNKQDLKGIFLIEKLTEKQLSDKEKEQFIFELLSILKRSSYRTKESILYLNYAISALSKLDIPENLFQKVLEEMIEKAFNWFLPIETKMNILYFCYKFSDKLKDERFKIFLPLLLTYIRDKKLTEGERNFIRTAVETTFSKIKISLRGQDEISRIS